MGDAQQDKEDAFIEKQKEKNELKLKLQVRKTAGTPGRAQAARHFVGVRPPTDLHDLQADSVSRARLMATCGSTRLSSGAPSRGRERCAPHVVATPARCRWERPLVPRWQVSFGHREKPLIPLPIALAPISRAQVCPLTIAEK